VLIAKVGRLGEAAEDLRGVVVAAKPPARVEVIDLLARVHVRAGGIGDLQAPPSLAALLPGLDLTSFNALPQEAVGGQEIPPDGIAREVEKVEVVPPHQAPTARELLTRVMA
jgi:hypothetical protein